MVLRATEGWDGYAVGLAGATWSAIFNDKWSNSSLGSTASVALTSDRYTDEKTYSITSTVGSFTIMLEDNPESLACGVYFTNEYHAYEREDWTFLLSVNNGANDEHVQLETSGRDIRVRVRNGTIDTIVYNVLEGYHRWSLIELKTKIHNTTGYWYLYVNGILVGSHTDMDTQYNDLVLDRVKFNHFNNFTNLSDTYVCDLTGSQNNDVLGAFHVQGILPDANGDDSDWTPSTAVDNYTLVNEETANEDSYVESGTPDEQDLYNYEDLTGTWDEIFGVQINTRAFLDASGSETVAILCSSNGTEDSANFTTTNTTMGTGDEQQFQRILEVDPDTSNAWDANGVDAAQFGVKFI
jgi:hypothetical protein